MKLLFITSNLFPVPNVKGGAVETLLTDLINVNEKKHEADITVGSKYNPDAVRKSREYKYTRFVWYDKQNDNKFLWLYRVIRYRSHEIFGRHVRKYLYSEQLYQDALEEKYDLIIVEEGDPFSFDAFSDTFGRNHMVAHVHSSWPANDKFHSIYGSVITPSVFTLKALIAGKWDDYQNNGYVVHNCINEMQFHPSMTVDDKRLLKEKLGIPDNHFILLFAGRIIPTKGVLELVKAMDSLKNCTLILAGSSIFQDSSKSDSYANLVKREAKGKKNIIATGLIPYNQIPSYYEICDAVITPTTSKESCCLANLEGLFMGKPIISTYDGAVPEYICDGRNGVLIDTDHLTENIVFAVNKLQSNPDMVKKISNQNLQDAQKYYRSSYYESMMKAIKSIIERNGEK